MSANDKAAATYHPDSTPNTGTATAADVLAERRGRTAWHMQVIDLRIGHDMLGFDYPVNGDAHPRKGGG